MENNHNIVMVFAIYQYESATGIRVPATHPEPASCWFSLEMFYKHSILIIQGRIN